MKNSKNLILTGGSVLLLLVILFFSFSRPDKPAQDQTSAPIERPPLEQHISQQLTPSATTAATAPMTAAESKKLTPKIREISDSDVLRALNAPKN